MFAENQIKIIYIFQGLKKYEGVSSMNGRTRGSVMAAGAGARGGGRYPRSPTTPKEGPSPSPSRNTLSPGELPLARPRRLSAPCGPQQLLSAPSSPAHRPPAASSRAASPCGFQRSEVGHNGSHSSRMSSDAWVCPNDRQLALRAK